MKIIYTDAGVIVKDYLGYIDVMFDLKGRIVSAEHTGYLGVKTGVYLDYKLQDELESLGKRVLDIYNIYAV